jgi:hypothetical protein
MVLPGTKKIRMRRNRGTCNGGDGCELVDSEYLDVERWELDSTSRDAAIAAQCQTRRDDAEIKVNKVAVYVPFQLDISCLTWVWPQLFQFHPNTLSRGPPKRSKVQWQTNYEASG